MSVSTSQSPESREVVGSESPLSLTLHRTGSTKDLQDSGTDTEKDGGTRRPVCDLHLNVYS